MTRSPPDVCDALGFCFTLDRHGWSDLLISCNGGIVRCHISDVFSDPASELLKLCRGVLANEVVSIALYDEPGGHALSVTPDARQQHTMLLMIQEFPLCHGAYELTGDEKTIISIRVKRKQLLGLLMAELWKVGRFLLEPSFQKDRQQGFPTETLQALNEEWDAHETLGPSFLK
ncbi:hypothetical protein HFO88_36450 [Rhizobium leguminosarum]|uniref:hypothetical protein n=1 Tax=Rhizobium leguminosarum TaxID=384 RepID=UPI001C945AE3|nr:hypothetical protein [Rhizobium leguminosarum]MBY5905728.1 hypothetical protein [Rhizobium leguminosarum]MBY5912776.1 hypothetical protein [Rhizobium leguminosarum]